MQYYDGQLFVPVSSKEEVANTSDIYNPCCSTHGLLVAFDAVSGGKNWVFHTTEDATLFVDTQRSGPNGVAIWSTPTIDAARNAIYIGTGQNYTEPVTVHSDAIVSVNMDNGLANWVFQARDNDAWNAACEYPDEQIEVAPGQLWNLYERCPQAQGQAFGFTAAPILADNGRVLIAGDKGGNVYSIDPDSGDINWQRKISTGGRNGGIHWGMAVDVNTVYVAATDLSANLANTDSPDAVALVEHAKPGIYALDLFDGGLIWETHRSHMYQGVATPSLYSASLSVTNDVLFAGSLDGVVTAFSTISGAELWSFDTAIPVTDVHGVAGNGGTIDSVGAVIAGDSVLINSGFNSFGGASPYQAGPGNTLFLLTLPQ
jgi:polyvinyl alcohol dehydrogenase (cytochrome)